MDGLRGDNDRLTQNVSSLSSGLRSTSQQRRQLDRPQPDVLGDCVLPMDPVVLTKQLKHRLGPQIPSIATTESRERWLVTTATRNSSNSKQNPSRLRLMNRVHRKILLDGHRKRGLYV